MCTRLTHFGAPVEQILCEASEWEWFLPDLGEYRATQVRHQRWLLRQHRLLCSAEERDWYPFWMLWWNRYTWRTPGRKAWWTGRRASSSWTRYWGTLWKCWYLQWQSCRRHPSTKCHVDANRWCSWISDRNLSPWQGWWGSIWRNSSKVAIHAPSSTCKSIN